MEINKQRIDLMDESKVSELTEIKIKHPSICWGCKKARKPWSKKLLQNGYVGCCLRVLPKYGYDSDINYDWHEIEEAKEICEGWVNLKMKPSLNDKGNGMVTNLQLLTLEVKECNQFEKEYE